MDVYAGQRVLVLGLGRSGRSTACWLANQGARVVVADESPAAPREPDAALRQAGIELRTGVPFPDPADFDLVVPSPGVPRARWADRARRAIGDIELAWRALAVPVVAITGTNGKTTTTALAVQLLGAAGLRAEAAGNIGRPALELVGRPLDVAVLEVSSFQMEAVESFRPRIAVILNLAPDHLDRHGSVAAYSDAKAQLFVRQGAGDTAIGNADDPAAAAIAARSGGRHWWFRTRGPVAAGAWWDAGQAVLRDAGTGPSGAGAPLRIPLDALAAAGAAAPPVDDVLAALLICRALGADVTKAAEGLIDFTPPPHRREPVAKHDGVTWIDDSKATNPAAAALALAAVPERAVWLAGGRGKGLDLIPLADVATARVRTCIFFGEEADALTAAIAGRIPVQRVADLEAAVALAGRLAQRGDTVLLSPACASFDQFRNYEERGERFRAAVHAWIAAHPEATG
ncbi:UDP-N-acetylmuramoyl-L-alanine--D-glutamate ligase [Myxococcota bacterium]|nr:UDP-N-acetylmuramoyl-L-alanine--D-glutamate ligase [Myxococcota bacterium]MCZ7620208.1 UDP-N-acetylmuramoyl-L-alanine--D-glutamate ligase [Myxococcota bacterium]